VKTLHDAPISWLQFPPSLAIQLMIVGAWVGTVIFLAEWLSRYTTVGTETVRKVVHIGTGNVILLAWWFGVPAWLGILASVLFSVLTVLSYKFPLLSSVSEAGRKSWGTFFYAISIGLLIALFWLHLPQYAVLGILVMTWGDGLAALVGQRWGRHPYTAWGMKKSWEGSLTMGFVSYVVSCLIFLGVQGNTWQSWLIPVVVALVATGLETFSKIGIDNLTVPLGSAALAFFLNELRF